MKDNLGYKIAIWLSFSVLIIGSIVIYFLMKMTVDYFEALDKVLNAPLFLGLASISLAIATFLKNQKADIKNNVKKIKKLLDTVKLANKDSKYIRKEGIDSLLKPNEKFEKTTKELDRVVNHLINACMLFFLGLVESLTLDLLINSVIN
ncbi:MAG: hypothetical protein R8G66_17660 [Cytophagales bacterium]|nr:hypothetical protein [Cytophagales bacterium]